MIGYLAPIVGILKSIPDTAVSACEEARTDAQTAATAAEEAASTVTSATVEETKTYLGI